MAIKINDIPPEGLSVEFKKSNLDLFESGDASTIFTSVLGIKLRGREILHLEGNVQADTVMECSRCLNIFPYHVETELSIDLAPINTLGTASEHELDRSELDWDFYEGDEIDLLAYVKEQILISIPMVPLHHPDCKGLCPVCGADLNEADCGCRKDGPEEFRAFAALKDKLKK